MAKVFISYSHDSSEHEERVLALAERLRKDGVDAQLDQYVAGTPPEGWPRWMLTRLDWANFVLLICTERYYRRFRGHEQLVTGKGADWEGNLVTLELYQTKSRSAKFAPVLFNGQDKQFIPEPISGHTHYLLDSEDSYAKLYAFLTGQAGVQPRGLGSLKTLARRATEPLEFDAPDTPPRGAPNNLHFGPNPEVTNPPDGYESSSRDSPIDICFDNGETSLDNPCLAAIRDALRNFCADDHQQLRVGPRCLRANNRWN